MQLDTTSFYNQTTFYCFSTLFTQTKNGLFTAVALSSHTVEKWALDLITLDTARRRKTGYVSAVV